MELNFRTLRADEIECRIGNISKEGKGLSLLLYKDARVDMDILDETVGKMNWKREHFRENANCVVSIYDETKKEWVSKEDTGTESNTEKEKGLASDSFKRSCVNWGIGRELYTSPFIWIDSNDCNITSNGSKWMCYDKFSVKTIGYDDKRNINALEIFNERTRKVVYHLGDTPVEPISEGEIKNNKEMIAPVDDKLAAEIKDLVEKTNTDVKLMLGYIKKTYGRTVKSVDELNMKEATELKVMLQTKLG